jgi:hypothetical protein
MLYANRGQLLAGNRNTAVVLQPQVLRRLTCCGSRNGATPLSRSHEFFQILNLLYRHADRHVATAGRLCQSVSLQWTNNWRGS